MRRALPSTHNRIIPRSLVAYRFGVGPSFEASVNHPRPPSWNIWRTSYWLTRICITEIGVKFLMNAYPKHNPMRNWVKFMDSLVAIVTSLFKCLRGLSRLSGAPRSGGIFNHSREPYLSYANRCFAQIKLLLLNYEKISIFVENNQL